MTLFRFLSAVILSLFACVAAKANYVQDCAASLQTDVSEFRSNYSLRYAYLKRVLHDQKTFNEASANGGIKAVIEDVPMGFDFGYKSVSDYTDRLESQLGLSYDLDQSSGVLQYALSAKGTDAFTKCVAQLYPSDYSFYLEVSSISPSFLIIKTHWTGYPDGAAAYMKIDVTVKGDPSKTYTITQDMAHQHGAPPFTIKRSKNAEIVVKASVFPKGGTTATLGDGIILPPYIVWRKVYDSPATTTKTAGPVSVRCGGFDSGFDGRTKISSPPTIITATGNEHLIPSTAHWIDPHTNFGIVGRYEFETSGVQDEQHVGGLEHCVPAAAEIGTEVSALFTVQSNNWKLTKFDADSDDGSPLHNVINKNASLPAPAGMTTKAVNDLVNSTIVGKVIDLSK